MLLASVSVSARDFRAADNQVADYPTVLAMQFMGKQISDATKGKYDIKVYANSSLGSGKDAIEQVKIGAIDLTRVSTSEFHGIIPESLVPSFPFLWRDIEHFRKVMNGPLGDELLKTFDQAGWIGLCFYEAGARSLYAKKPVRTLADAKGLKIRVQPSDLWVAIIAAMGGTATPIPYGEVYTALKTGLVDAAENNYPSYDTTKHYEAAPIYSETQHVMAPDVVVFSKKVWDTLSREEQEIIRKAAKDSVAYYTKLWTEKEQVSKEYLKKEGVTFVDDVKREEFVTAMRPVWDRFAPTPELKTLVQKIVDTQ
ncbi:MAG: TRAP transporter substrate-binding protein [Candidatus Accumulibacter sp.]|jgi:tripartite ATP-independent transporter DctP family solute receptor|nr:TRAP transporter substrate-binding protein [Accumulibacter sp.]